MNVNEQIATAKKWEHFENIHEWCDPATDKEYPDGGLPDWEHDIAAAWGLVEEMSADFENITIENSWRCEVDNMSRTLVGIADTAPAAISLAWLKWKGAK